MQDYQMGIYYGQKANGYADFPGLLLSVRKGGIQHEWEEEARNQRNRDQTREDEALGNQMITHINTFIFSASLP